MPEQSKRHAINIPKWALRIHDSVVLALSILAGVYPPGHVTAAQRKIQGPDPLIEASRYAVFAKEAVECTAERTQDPFHEALRWTTLAIKKARDFKSEDKTEQGIAAAFLASEVRTLEDLKVRLVRLDAIYRNATKQIKQARLEAAKATLSDVEIPPCEARFSILKGKLGNLRRAADNNIGRADAILASDPKRALKLYQDANRLVTDDPTITMRIARAQQAEVHSSRHKTLPGSVYSITDNLQAPLPDASPNSPAWSSAEGLMWRGVTGDNLIRIRFHDDKMFMSDQRDAPLAELSLQHANNGKTNRYIGRYFFQAPGYCKGGGRIEVTAWSTSRIEGRLERPFPGARKGNNEPDYGCSKILLAVGAAVWSRFVLVPQN